MYNFLFSKETSRISRRGVLKIGTSAVGLASMATLSLTDVTYAATSKLTSNRDNGLQNSLNKAFQFQDFMVDLYATGSTPRLSQSYSDQVGLLSTAFTYDNALTIIAYLRQPGATGLARAKALGDGLLYAQQHDPVGDGRLRQGYFSNPFILADGSINLALAPFFFLGSAVGDLAWSGLALAHLFARTRDQRYLQGALGLANWIYDHTYDTRGAGGYNFGVDASQNALLYKSTEHNIDTYAFFSMLAQLTGNYNWRKRALHALTFITAMWNSTNSYFYTGTVSDGATINTGVIPEDVQTWSYLALRDERYAASINWTVQHLASTDTAQAPNASFTDNLRFSGITFSNVSLTVPPVKPPDFRPAPDPDAVWFEGTAHTATALRLRHHEKDGKTADSYLAAIQLAQASLGKNQTANGIAIPQGLGIVAASSPLDTGFGFDYFPALHIGATAWYGMAGLGINPYHLD